MASDQGGSRMALPMREQDDEKDVMALPMVVLHTPSASFLEFVNDEISSPSSIC